MNHAQHLTTRALARLLGVRCDALRAAARRLGLVPGVTVTLDTGTPVVTRVWPTEWTEEIRREIAGALRDLGAR
jgi:hypothetical protein